MSVSTILIWFLPTGLVAIFLYRILASRTESQSINSTKRNNRGIIVFSFLVVFTVTFFIVNHFSDTNKKCRTAITPEQFSQMIRDNKKTQGIFHDNKFDYTEQELLNDSHKLYTLYNYTLYEASWEKNNDPRNEHRIEYVWRTSESITYMHYVLREREEYDSFFDYLKSIGADSLSAERFVNYEYWTENYPSFEYKKCVFVMFDYLNNSEGFTIGLFPFDSLKPIKL